MSLPLSLYIHIPWCIKKCPYCDFNSHVSPHQLPEEQYVQTLIEDLEADLELTSNRPIQSIFIGGGTPSLLSARAYETLFLALQKVLTFDKNIEITLEANPSSVEYERFRAYREIGINRLSVGIQSFDDTHLKKLGRVHDQKSAKQGIEAALKANFTRLNLDLMYGLPNQTVQEALLDIDTALSYQPSHLSWYQLTLEPNTVFYKNPPQLPDEITLEMIEQQGLKKINHHGFKRYEISAFCQQQDYARHNLNYWHFGDYLGIGAGAHGKLSNLETGVIVRTQKQRLPKDYLNPKNNIRRLIQNVMLNDLPFEYMLNAARLEHKILKTDFLKYTGQPWALIEPLMSMAIKKGFIETNATHWWVSPLGRLFTNDLQSMFLNPLNN